MKTISPISAVIENSAQLNKPEIDWTLFSESIRELIVLHMEGKAGKDQVIFDDVVRQLKFPLVRRRAETMTHHLQIINAIHNLVDTIYAI